MSPERKLTEDFVKTLIHDEQKEWRADIRQFQQNQVDVNERLLGGASAAILSATILHGSPQNGIKGAIPDIQDRLTSLERRAEEAERLGTERHTANEARFTVLEKGQHRMRRAYDATLKTDGHYSYAKLTAAVSTALGLAHEINSHGHAWWVATKKFAVAFFAAWR